MINKKGFTLMELLVAVFISGMVTVALAAVWKAASLQTSQSQRQTVLKNNVTIFLREMHKNIAEADTIFFPSSSDNNKTFLVGGRRVYKSDMSNWASFCVSEDNPNYSCATNETTGLPEVPGNTKFFEYCLNGSKIMYKESSPGGNTGLISALNAAECTGSTVINNVTNFNVKAIDNATFEVTLDVNKDFGDGTTPIKIHMVKVFTSAGGM